MTNRPVTVSVAFGSSQGVTDIYVRLKAASRPPERGIVRGAGIVCNPQCSRSYAYGTRVALRAEPAEGSRFERWRGACQTDALCSLQAGAVTAVQALFGARVGEPTTTVTQTTTVTNTVTQTERRVFTVALHSVRVTGRGRTRRIVVRAEVNRPAEATIRLQRARRSTRVKRAVGPNRPHAFVLVPRGWPRGPVRVLVVIASEDGSSPTYERRLVLPR
jgi:hypothetical protein